MKGREPQDTTPLLKTNMFLGVFEKEMNTGLTGLSMSQPCFSLSVYLSVCLCLCSLTSLLVGLFVRPDDGAEAGEDQCAQSAGSFLRSAVVVQGVLAQHKPEPTLLDPVASYLPQQPSWLHITQKPILLYVGARKKNRTESGSWRKTKPLWNANMVFYRELWSVIGSGAF